MIKRESREIVSPEALGVYKFQVWAGATIPEGTEFLEIDGATVTAGVSVEDYIVPEDEAGLYWTQDRIQVPEKLPSSGPATIYTPQIEGGDGYRYGYLLEDGSWYLVPYSVEEGEEELLPVSVDPNGIVWYTKEPQE